MAKIGKNVLENLTQAMYDDSRVIFREYIQNSADQIDYALKNNSFPHEKLEIYINLDARKNASLYVITQTESLRQKWRID